MGIRIHKVLGYGVDNIQHGKKGWDMQDPRIDTKKFRDLHSKAYEMGGPEILKWLKNEKEALVQFHDKHHPSKQKEKDDEFRDLDFQFFLRGIEDHLERKKIHDFGSSIIWDGEYGLPNVMQFVPITCPDWRRYDDTIDYHEETDGREQANWVKFLKVGGIFPWNGWVRFRDPKPGILKEDAKKGDLVRLDPATYSQLVGWWDKREKPLALGDTLKHFLEDYRPILPIDVTSILWFMRNAFKDVDSFLNELRPMIYVYWA